MTDDGSNTITRKDHVTIEFDPFKEITITSAADYYDRDFPYPINYEYDPNLQAGDVDSLSPHNHCPAIYEKEKGMETYYHNGLYRSIRDSERYPFRVWQRYNYHAYLQVQHHRTPEKEFFRILVDQDYSCETQYLRGITIIADHEKIDHINIESGSGTLKYTEHENIPGYDYIRYTSMVSHADFSIDDAKKICEAENIEVRVYFDKAEVGLNDRSENKLQYAFRFVYMEAVKGEESNEFSQDYERLYLDAKKKVFQNIKKIQLQKKEAEKQRELNIKKQRDNERLLTIAKWGGGFIAIVLFLNWCSS